MPREQADALTREIRRVERAYDRALKRPRGEGLAELGADLHRLYARQRHAAQHDPQLQLPTTTARSGR